MAVFKEGDYVVRVGDHKVTVHVPRDWHLDEFARAFAPVRRKHHGRKKSDAA